jgi:hypothetical protein
MNEDKLKKWKMTLFLVGLLEIEIGIAILAFAGLKLGMHSAIGFSMLVVGCYQLWESWKVKGSPTTEQLDEASLRHLARFWKKRMLVVCGISLVASFLAFLLFKEWHWGLKLGFVAVATCVPYGIFARQTRNELRRLKSGRPDSAASDFS